MNGGNFPMEMHPSNLRLSDTLGMRHHPVTYSFFSLSSSKFRDFPSITLLFLLLVAACGCSRADASKAKPSSYAFTDAEIAGLSGDASTDIHALSDYSKTVYSLLKAEKFEQLDNLADTVRSHKETFPGGMWKIHTIYTGLARPPLHATEEDWKTHLDLLQSWVSARPDSVTARIALAESYVNYGADARGSGFADTVSESGWKLFAERTAKAKKILDEASSLPTKDPEWYFAMQTIALGSWDPAARRALLEQAVKFEPTYYYYYRSYAYSILPKWGGEQGEAENFLQTAADRIGGDAGDILYFRVAGILICGCQNDQQLNLSWPRIQKGFAAVEKQNGPSPVNWNLLAHMAQSYNDAFVAEKMFAKVGDQWSEDIWHTSSAFESARQWAKQMGPMAARKHAGEESAEANLQTDEGRRYQAAFEEKIHTWMQACVQESASSDPGTHELLVKVGKEGTVEDMIGVGSTSTGFCLARKLAESRLSKQAVFPQPPQGDYWVRFDLNLPGSASAALN